MRVEVTFTEDPGWFLDRAAPVLAADPLLATVVATATRGLVGEEPPVPGAPPRWWALLHDRDAAGPVDGGLVGVAMRTMDAAPHALYLLPMPDAAAVALARALHDRGEQVVASNGAMPASGVLAAECARLTGGTARVREHHRLHRLGDLVRPRPTSGALRPWGAGDADLRLAASWFDAFHVEADLQAGREPEAREPTEPGSLRDRVRAGEVWCWEVDGEPVHLTAARPPADGVARIGPVYTPPGHRGRGYASAAVHDVAALLRDAGSTVCLFTDLANPTSNRIYAALGFEAYADLALHRIDPPAAS